MTRKFIGIAFVCILLIMSGCKKNEDFSRVPLIESEGPSEVITKLQEVETVSPIVYPFFEKNETQLVWGLKDEKKRVLLEPVYDSLEYVAQTGFFRANKDNIAYLLDKNGRILFETVYEQFSNRLERYLDQVTDLTVPFYDDKTQRYGYRRNGNIVIDPIYYEATPFIDNYAVVSLNESLTTYAIIDMSGTTYWSMSEYQIINLGRGYFGLRDSLNQVDLSLTPMTIHDYHGVLVFESPYYEILPLATGDFFVHDGYKGFYVDKKGEKILSKVEFEGYLTYSQMGSVIEGRTYFGYTISVIYFDDHGNVLWQETVHDEPTLEQPSMQQHYNRHLVQANKFLKIDSIIIDDNSKAILNQTFQERIDDRVNQYAILADGLSSTEIVSTIDFFEGYVLLTTDYFQYAKGAAHGNYDYSYDYFDLLKNEWISLDDFFKDFLSAKESLAYYVNHLSLAKGIEGYEDIEIDKNRQFTLSESSLNISFKLYEIGPYVIGMPEIEIPYIVLINSLVENPPLNLQHRISTITQNVSTEDSIKIKQHIQSIISNYTKAIVYESLDLFPNSDSPLSVYWQTKFNGWQQRGVEKIPAFSISPVRQQKVSLVDFEGYVIEVASDFVFEMEDGTVNVESERTFYYVHLVEDLVTIYMAIDAAR